MSFVMHEEYIIDVPEKNKKELEKKKKKDN